MRKFLLVTLLFVFGASYAQTVKFSEDFESIPLSVTSSSNGSASWARTNNLQYSGNYSDSASLTAAGDTTILTTNVFSTSGYNHVLLRFNQIAKLALFDGGYLEVSDDNGSSWNRLTDTEYHGVGYFGSSPNYMFNSSSYAADWDFMNTGSIPQNSWWKEEIFDLSNISANASNVKVRFVLYGATTTTYGWLIDDIEITVSNNDLVPPSITYNTNPSGTVIGTGPFLVNANIIDSNGVADAKLIYTVAGVSDTLAMVNLGTGAFEAYLPSFSYGTSVCYKVIATDIYGNKNTNPALSCISYLTQKDPNAPPAFPYDVAMYDVANPSSIAIANVPVPVQIQIENKGDSTLTKAQITWEIDGVAQTPYSWTGNLTNDMVSTPFTISNNTFSPGYHDISVVATNPNDSIDQDPSNDSLSMTFYACNSILSGTYTLGGNNPDFATFSDLFDALNHCGINGPTTIKVAPGVYHESLVFSNLISGLGALNTLTIESATNNPDDVMISTDLATDNYVVLFDSVSWISLNNISISSTDEGIGSLVSVTNMSSDITIDGCKLMLAYDNKPSLIAIDVNGAQLENISIKNNTIHGGYIGVKLYGSSAFSDYQKSIIVSGNNISGFYYSGIYMSYLDKPLIKANNVEYEAQASSTSAVRGIYIYRCLSPTIESNSLVLNPANAAYGLYFNYAGGGTTKRTQVTNNMISVTSNSATSTIYGVYSSASSFMDFYYNSISVNTGSTSNSNAFYMTGSSTTDVNVNNNVFANYAGGFAFSRMSGTFTSLDYNDYYTTGLLIARWSYSNSTPTSAGITGIQNLTSDDAHSFVSNPKFYSSTNLHSFDNVLDGAALPIVGVTTDIDGDTRNTATPDVGADEFVVSTTDAGVLSIISPLSVDTQSNIVPLKVIVKNYGSSPLTSFDIKYQVNGSSLSTYSWTGNLVTAGADTVSLGMVTVPIGGYEVMAYTVLSGDTLNFNDTAHSIMNGLPLVELEVVKLISPSDGCGKTNAETISIRVKNNGVGTVSSGATVSYKVNNGTFITETISAPIYADSTIIHTFVQTADLATGYQDSTFYITATVSHSADMINANDTALFTIESFANLYPPIVSDTTINYGASVLLTASSPSTIMWYESDTSNTVISVGNYTTPLLFDTTTYYAQANMYNPPATATVGNGTSTLGYFDANPYGVNMGSGRYQVLYTSAELLAVGITAGDIESIAFQASSQFSGPSAGLEIKVANVSNTFLTSTFLNPTLTTVFTTTSSYTVTAGWNTHTFDNPFYWDGTSSLLIDICQTGSPYNGGPIIYTTTPQNMVTADQGMGAGCTSSTGFAKSMRPNIRIVKQGTNGCYSAKVPLTVNVPLPLIDARVSDIVGPTDACGLASAEVIVEIQNMGTDTIYGPYTATYKVGNNAYIAAETINTTIAPSDTLQYTFNTLANLAPGASGTDYTITAKVNVPSDSYANNDTLISDTIFSIYTPINPVVTNITINYADSALLQASASDTVYWYADSMGLNLVGEGSNFTTAPLYDTTIFYAQTAKTVPQADYTFGMGTQISAYGDPSPYGAGGYNGWGARTQFIITADEMKAMGMIQGPVSSVSFNVATVVGVPLLNYSIKMANTSMTDMLGVNLESNLVDVYSVPSYTEHASWNEHVFSVPFFWDGHSNVIVQTCFKNFSGVASAGVYYTTTSDNLVGYNKNTSSFSCTDSIIQYNSPHRPNIKMSQKGIGFCKSDLIEMDVNVINYSTVDAAMTSIVEPNNYAYSNVPTDVKVVINNYGLNAMTSASINWEVNGVAQTPFAWVGAMSMGGSDTVTIASNYLFSDANTEIKAWVSLLNDTVAQNDTTTTNIIVSMSGTYTINPVSGDYHSFTEAIADLQLAGICGPVVFDVDSAVYNEQVVLNAVQGSSAINTITFQSTAQDSTKAIMSYSTLSNENYVFKISGASYITIKSLGFIANGNTHANVIVLSNKASNISILNNKMQSSQAIGYSVKAANIYTSKESVDDVTIANNLLLNGNKSIYIEGSNADSISNYSITNNTLEGFTYYGMRFGYVNNLEIKKNSLVSSPLYSSVFGVYIYHNEDGLMVNKNTITISSSNTSYGLYVSSAIGTSNNRVSVNNNFVSLLSGSGTLRGLYIYASSYIDVVYNSVNSLQGSNSSSALNLGSGGGHYNVQNNTLVARSGYAFYASNILASSIIDYNNFYVDTLTSTKFVKFVSDHADLAALKVFDANNNQHAVSVNPLYYSSTDLHAQQISIYNAATPIINVTTDIDSDIRSTTAPSIGADEFSPPAIDFGLVKVAHPINSSCGFAANDSIVIRVKNYGLNNLNFANSNASISVIVGGMQVDTINYVLNSGTLNSGDEMNVKVANNFDLSTSGQYTFVVSSSIANDGNLNNDNLAIHRIVSYPNIDVFPFFEDFESGMNLSFKEIKNSESNVAVSLAASNNSTTGLHFQGGSYANWTGASDVTSAFANTEHIAIAQTCNVDASALSSLMLQFDLRQTRKSTNTSWFRVLLIDANSVVHYLKNTNGDSVFIAQTTNNDPFATYEFVLDNYAGQNFQISFEAANKYAYVASSGQGDNVYIDNIRLWEPKQIDIAMGNIESKYYHGAAGDLFQVKTSFTNMGTDTLYSIPFAYQVDNGTIVRDTANGMYLPFTSDTFAFVTPYALSLGDQTISAFVELANDAENSNDTTFANLRGMPTYTVNYEDDFETKSEWFARGLNTNWKQGTPNKANITGAYSGQNAWVTSLTNNYQPSTTAYLYTPYMVIPTYASTATVEFQMFMDVISTQAKAVMEYSFDGTTWVSYGYIGLANSVNWYNHQDNGVHYWSMTNSGWNLTSAKLDSMIFNTGQAFQIRFKFTSNNSAITADGMAIDDFKVTIPAFVYDAGVSAILDPQSSTAAGEDIEVKVEVKNFGSTTLTNIPMEYEIDGNVIATENWTGSLAINEVDTFTFTTKYTAPNHDYSVCAYTSLTNEMQPNNDTSCAMMLATAGKIDGGVSAILAPSGQTSIGKLTEVEVTIRNFGTDTLENVPVSYRLNGSLIASEVSASAIAPGDSVAYLFATKYPSAVGNYSICAQTDIVNDVDASNDGACVYVVGTSINGSNSDGFKVSQNQPNPANDNTTIEFYIPKSGTVQFRLVNMVGELVSEQTNNYDQGKHELIIKTSDYAVGVYYYSLSFDGQIRTFKMVIVQ